mmetsp:Transcript_6576/g.14869  ORF Transcript_6576/g.14869 Transcript_6576/m.14869 type:complete len:82 (+) Transcript_6576:273-518(+)
MCRFVISHIGDEPYEQKLPFQFITKLYIREEECTILSQFKEMSHPTTCTSSASSTLLSTEPHKQLYLRKTKALYPSMEISC